MSVVTIADLNEPAFDMEKVFDALQAEKFLFNCVRKNNKGFAVHMFNQEEKMKILRADSRQLLETKHKLKVLKPPDYRAACTIMVSDYSHDYYDLTNSELADRISRKMGIKVTEIEFISFSTMKIECNTPEEADKIVNKAILIEPDAILPDQMEKQRYMKVPQCTSCFSYEHERADCTVEELVCFICGEEGHTNITCENKENPKCRNCGGPHVAIAFKCVYRKIKKRELMNRTNEEEEGGASASQEEGATAEGASAVSPVNKRNDSSNEGRNDHIHLTLEDLDRITQRVYDTVIGAVGNNDSRSTSSSSESGEECDEEETQQRRLQRDRGLRAPDPERGEGPRRHCRRIPNFKEETETVFFPTPNVFSKFPVLPKRQLRCV